MRLAWPIRRPSRRRRRSPAPLAVRRLERRRVLNADIQAVILPATAFEGDTVPVAVTGRGDAPLFFDWSVSLGSDTIASGFGPSFNFVAPDNGIYEVHITLFDSSQTSDSVVRYVEVFNVAPTIDTLTITTPINENDVAILSGTYSDPGLFDTHLLEIDWDGDGIFDEIVNVSGGTFSVEFQYLDDDPTGTPSDTFFVNVRLSDNDGDSDTASVEITVDNVVPELTPIEDQTVDEGELLDLTGLGSAPYLGSFTDIGSLDTHTAQIDWGDGTIVAGSIDQLAGGGFVGGSHTYADDGVYTVVVRLADDDMSGDFAGGVVGVDYVEMSFNVTVSNVAPELTLVADQTVDEGELLDLTGLGGAPFLGTFTDAGVLDTHTATIDWGDGSVEPGGIVQMSGSGSVVGSHTYADNGVYVVRVTLYDDDGDSDSQTFMVTVNNVAPTLIVVDDQTIDEGAELDLPGLGLITDPGFDNPDHPDGPTFETFTFWINWGDGTAAELGTATIDVIGAPGMLTEASFGGSHVYADNGVYTVTVRVADDDMSTDFIAGMAGVDFVEQTFLVTVDNVVPTLTVVDDQTIDEGAMLDLPGLGLITDPGFDNPDHPDGPTFETFTYWIDWGDGTAAEMGMATIDAIGAPDMLTEASFGGSHVYADNGTYTVTVRVADDDMSADFMSGMVDVDFVEQTFLVTVDNVDPELTGTADLVLDEGQAFTLSDLGVGITDPGFDNPANPFFQPGGSVEMFEVMQIDWGDGTVFENTLVDPAVIAIVNRNSPDGGPTTAEFDHAPHTYADNGEYTVAVTIRDDDGDWVTREFVIRVDNVEPTLFVTDEVFVIDEGTLLVIPDLARLTDPGFDNPNNPLMQPDGSVESFRYWIDWGDGTAADTGDAPITQPGAAGVLTEAAFGGSHFYADNDPDNTYTITVRVADDDMSGDFDSGIAGIDFVEQTFEITVFNVDPTLLPIAATDVNSSGQTTLTLAFFDPGADEFEVLVDWGDMLGEPDLDQRFVVEAVTSGAGMHSFTIVHQYTGPPDPLNPTADIIIRVKIHDDDVFTVGVIEPGISNTETVAITNPGIADHAVAIDTTPEVPRLDVSPPPVVDVFLSEQATSAQVVQASAVRAASSEMAATTERYLELRVVFPDGTESEGYRLPDDALQDLRALFATLPDNRYVIYLVRTDNNSYRLVMEVEVRHGRLIDVSDESEGTRDRPPTAETPIEQPEVIPLDEHPLLERLPEEAGEENHESPQTSAPPGRWLRWAAPLAAIGAAGGGRWSVRVDAALGRADERAWQRLRRAARIRR